MYYNLNEFSVVVDVCVVSYMNVVVDVVKDVVDVESVGKTAIGASGDGVRRGSRGFVVLLSGVEYVWEDVLWCCVDVVMEIV